MQWHVVDDTIAVHSGHKQSNNIAAFNFNGTLAWSDSGANTMTHVNDWVVPSGATNFKSFLQTLKTDTQINLNVQEQRSWTIVIFINESVMIPQQIQEFQGIFLHRIEFFIDTFFDEEIYNLQELNPFVYISTKSDDNHKPNPGMWHHFLNNTGLVPSPASFYCGNKTDDEIDEEFAANCGLAFYTSDDIIGQYIPPPIPENAMVLLLMFTDISQYMDWLDPFMKEHPGYEFAVFATGKIAMEAFYANHPIIITSEPLTTLQQRNLAAAKIPVRFHAHTYILLFTRPIEPFLTDFRYQDFEPEIQTRADDLDIHFNDEDMDHPQGEPFPIIRIN